MFWALLASTAWAQPTTVVAEAICEGAVPASVPFIGVAQSSTLMEG